MGVLVAGMTTFMDNSNREAKTLQQKLDIVQTEQDLMRDLSDPALCACNFDPTKNTAFANLLSFNASDANSRIELPQLFGTCVNGVPGSPIAIQGQKVPGSQSGLVVGHIRLQKFEDVGTGRFRAELEVGFDSGSLLMGRKPVTVGMSIQATTAGGQSTITACTTGRDIASVGTVPGDCPPTPVNNLMALNATIPSAPVGTYAYLGYNFPGGGQRPEPTVFLTAFEPSCGNPFFRCDYTQSGDQQPLWSQMFMNSCPDNNSGP